MLTSRIENILKLAKAKRDFADQATLGKNVKLLPQASITNDTKDKTRVVIGENCELGCHMHIETNGSIIIGSYTTIRYSTNISSTCGVTIGNDVIISNNCYIYDNNSHPTSPSRRREMTRSGFHGDMWKNKYAESKPIIIEDNVWVGQKAMIMKGVTIGKGSIVAAGAIVTRDVPPYSVVAGNPAKVVKTLDPDS